MTALGYHSNASMAVKAVVSRLRDKFSRKFNFLEGMPEFFYDFDKGLSPQFKQYYAKIPEYKRQEPWIALAYSYDTSDSSSVQPRNGLSYARNVTDSLKRYIDLKYCDLPVVFSVMTNDSKLMNGISTYASIQIDHSFTVRFPDLLWPLWQPDSVYPLGWYVRPTEYNGLLYMTVSAGRSGEIEPSWTTSITDTQSDNELSWKPLEAPMLSVRAGSFVKNPSIIQNPIDSGIMYQYDFGLTLHYVDFDDSGEIVGVITEVEMELLEKYWNNREIDKIIIKK